ncbi:hypothetical protein AVEN_11031-1 [Araneus ventricosus]|uniref:Uncharacterized protein n=1 Tax=Araneus ventricosus TaxID=182803 RepID=A0A4Y2GG17_ARAVE|nr:hypothetical protein AVEN_11031-1 [Araneus ventricosus]
MARTIPALVPLSQISVPPTDDFFYLDIRFKQHQEALPPWKIGRKNPLCGKSDERTRRKHPRGKSDESTRRKQPVKQDRVSTSRLCHEATSAS